MGIPTVHGIGVETGRPATPVYLENPAEGAEVVQSASPGPATQASLVRLSYEDSETLKQILLEQIKTNEWLETIATSLGG